MRMAGTAGKPVSTLTMVAVAVICTAASAKSAKAPRTALSSWGALP